MTDDTTAIDAAAKAMFEDPSVVGDYTWEQMVEDDPTRADVWREDARRIVGAYLAALPEKPTMTADSLARVMGEVLDWRWPAAPGVPAFEEVLLDTARAILAELDPPRLPLNREQIEELTSTIKGYAVNARTLGRLDEERKFLDLLILVERFDPPTDEWEYRVEVKDTRGYLRGNAGDFSSEAIARAKLSRYPDDGWEANLLRRRPAGAWEVVDGE